MRGAATLLRSCGLVPRGTTPSGQLVRPAREAVAAGGHRDPLVSPSAAAPSEVTGPLVFGFRKDLRGRQFGKWAVLGPVFVRGERSRWNVRCSCGAERTVLAQVLLSGASTSCGCGVRAARNQRRQKRQAAINLLIDAASTQVGACKCRHATLPCTRCADLREAITAARAAL